MATVAVAVPAAAVARRGRERGGGGREGGGQVKPRAEPGHPSSRKQFMYDMRGEARSVQCYDVLYDSGVGDQQSDSSSRQPRRGKSGDEIYRQQRAYTVYFVGRAAANRVTFCLSIVKEATAY